MVVIPDITISLLDTLQYGRQVRYLGTSYLGQILLLHECVHLAAQPGVDSWHLLPRKADRQPLPLSQPHLPCPVLLHRL